MQSGEQVSKLFDCLTVNEHQRNALTKEAGNNVFYVSADD